MAPSLLCVLSRSCGFGYPCEYLVDARTEPRAPSASGHYSTPSSRGLAHSTAPSKRSRNVSFKLLFIYLFRPSTLV